MEGQLLDKARLFRNRDELVRHHEAPSGVVPADQGLDTDHSAAPYRDLRLIVEDELLILDGLAQVADQTKACRSARVHRCVVERVPEACVLGHVHRRVSAPKKRFDVDTVAGRSGDADADSEVHGQSFKIDRLLDRRTNAANDLENLRATRLGHEHGELVAAEPGDRVVLAQSLSEAPSDLSQHLVAGRVAERVVDLLEPIQVHYEHGQLTAALLRLGDRLSDALVKEGAIGEPGERVVQGVIANLPLDALARLVCRLLPRDVEDHADCPLSTAIRAQNWPAVLGDPPRLPAHVDQPVLERVRSPALKGIAHLPRHVREVLGMNYRVVGANAVVDEVARRVTDEILDLIAHELDRPCRVASAAVHDAWDVGDDRADVLPGAAQVRLGLPWRDVEAIPVKRGGTGSVGYRHGPVVDPQDGPVLADHPVLAHERLAVGRRVPVLDQDSVPVVWVQQSLEQFRVVEDAVRRDPEDSATADAEVVDQDGNPRS